MALQQKGTSDVFLKGFEMKLVPWIRQGRDIRCYLIKHFLLISTEVKLQLQIMEQLSGTFQEHCQKNHFDGKARMMVRKTSGG